MHNLDEDQREVNNFTSENKMLAAVVAEIMDSQPSIGM